MKHLFFDLDHTLWDFERNSEAALQHLFAELKLDEKLRSFRSFHTQYKKINAELWFQYGKGQVTKEELRVRRFRDTLRHFESDDPELALALADGYIRISPYQKHLFPGTQELLQQLKQEHYVLHIITNGFMEIQDIKLKTTDIQQYFDVILCSEEVGKQKPHPLVFETALARAGAKKQESIMIGDNLHTDVLGAERAGISAILFDPQQQHARGTHDWHVQQLNEIPGLIPWIAKTK